MKPLWVPPLPRAPNKSKTPRRIGSACHAKLRSPTLHLTRRLPRRVLRPSELAAPKAAAAVAKRRGSIAWAVVFALTVLSGSAAAADAAKDLFGAIATPSTGSARVVGGYSRGCLEGAVQLPADGPTWQGMRLSRNRHWGHPILVEFVQELSEAAPELGLRGLLVGDMSQPRGGPMQYGHASHQIGLDVDFWFAEMPDLPFTEPQREDTPFLSTLTEDGKAINPEQFGEPFARLLKRAAEDPRVGRIFVHPLIKKRLCGWSEAGSGKERTWLRRVRPWYGHFEHFHVRLNCPTSQRACRKQAAPPPGDGCGAPLDYWFTDAPYKPAPGVSTKPKPPLTLADLPAACRALVPVGLAAPKPRRKPDR